MAIDVLDRVEAAQRPARDGRTDPLEAAVRFSEHVDEFELPTPKPTPTLVVADPDYSVPSDGLNWAALRQCESGGNYQTNTGNGFSGAYQFLDSTWQSMGGTGSAYQASPAEQDMRARMLLEASGDEQWPVCGDLLYS